MNEATLKFLLDFAEYDQPIQRSYFDRNPAVCFKELAAEGYLKPAAAPDEIYVLLDGERRLVHRMEVRGKMKYWCSVEGETVDLDSTVAQYYTLDYSPFAKLLKTYLRAEVTDDGKSPNRAWDLGAPDAALDEVHLVRNGGTDAEVIRIMSSYGDEDTVYWFGTEPDASSTPAKLCRLSSFLTCVGGKICHRDKLPPSLRMADDYETKRFANRIVKRGKYTYEFTFNNVGPVPISDHAGAAYLARIIRGGAEGVPLLEVIAGVKVAGEKPSREDIETHGMDPELAIHVLDLGSRRLYESTLALLDEQIREAEEDEAASNLIQTLKSRRKVVQGILNAPRSFKDGFSKLSHLVREAIRTSLCNKLTKEGLGDLATHLRGKGVIVVGTYCYYKPQQRTEWDIRI